MVEATLERWIRIIPATKKETIARGPRRGRQRVAAYCRVSADSEEQLNSYAAQKAYYTQKIEENPDLEMAGVFADENLSGTSMKKRKDFNRMIAACKRGWIDMILTKSLSCFARNTVDCLETVRRIYRRYLDGCSLGQIKAELEADGTPTASGVKGWSYQVIHDILTNEKYCGDALLQKTYITDCIRKIVRKNNGELPMYFVENNHEAIIPRSCFIGCRRG